MQRPGTKDTGEKDQHHGFPPLTAIILADSFWGDVEGFYYYFFPSPRYVGTLCEYVSGVSHSICYSNAGNGSSQGRSNPNTCASALTRISALDSVSAQVSKC